MRRGLGGLLWVVAVLGLVAPGQAWARQGMPGAPTWQPGPQASGDNTFQGAVDSPTPGAAVSGNRLITMTGWVVDTSAQGWTGVDDLQVFLGSMDGGTLLARGTVGLNRPDVAASLANPYWTPSGWSANIDTGGLPSGQDVLSAYVHTPSKGWWFAQVSVTVGTGAGAGPITTISGPPVAGPLPVLIVDAPLENEKVSTRLGNYKITGNVRDPVGGVKTIDWVSIWLNGEQNTDGATFLGEPDIGSDGSWSLDFSPGKYTALASNLYVYAHSDVTGRVKLLVVHFEISDRPA